MNNKSLLAQLKGEILAIVDDIIFDDIEQDHLNYVMNLLDWMLMGKVPIDKDSISQLGVELIQLHIYEPNAKVLSLLPKLEEFI